MRRSHAKRRLLLTVMVAIAVVGGVLAVVLWGHAPKPQPFQPLKIAAAQEPFTLAATDQDYLGVAPTTSFLLTSKTPVSADALQHAVVFRPRVRFKLASRGGNRFEIRPQQRLEPNCIYHVSLHPPQEGARQQSVMRALEWAFQTKTQFRVLNTLPRNEATQVPVNTGIEVTFSHDNFEVADAAKHFEITPAANGRFEKHKRVLVFVPDGLNPETIYTVRIGKSFPLTDSRERLAQDFAFQFETAASERAKEPSVYLEFANRMSEVSPTEVPLVEVNASEVAPKDLRVSVYRFQDADAFLRSLQAFDRVPGWCYYERRRFRVDTTGMARVLWFRPRVQEIPAPEGFEPLQYIRLPERLPQGFYLLDASLPRAPEQAWLQVSDTAVYLATSGTKCLAWVNSLGTKSAIPGATVALVNGDFTTRTNDRGAALFDTPPRLKGNRPAHYFLIAAPGGEQLVVPAETNLWNAYYDLGAEGEYEEESPDYLSGNATHWRYLYTDRILYQPTDTVRFFGFVRRRYKGGSPPQVTVTITRNGYHDYYYNPLTVAEQTLPVSKRGFFHGEFRVANYEAGDYALTVSHQDFEMSAGFRVEPYVKPAYSITVTPQRRGVFAGEPIVFRTTSAFFEGTPVPHTTLAYRSDNGKREGAVTTDDKGRADLKFETRYEAAQDYPYTVEVTLTPRRAEMGEISGSSSATVFGARLALDLEARTKEKARRATARVTVHEIDLERFERGDDYRGATVAGQTVTGRIVEHWDVKVREGYETEYDFINKRVRKVERCRWVPKEKTVATFSGDSDRRGHFAYGFSVNPERSYQVEVEARDGQGRIARTKTWAYRPWPSSGLSLERETAKGEVSVGETVALAARQGRRRLPTGDHNSYLFYTAQNGIRDCETSASPNWTHRFSEADIPNLYVRAVWFNGVTYVPCGDDNLDFNEEDRRLEIEVTTDKPRYAPADEAELTVKVTDGAGKPVSAEVNLCMVDDAFYAIQEERYTDPLTTLYENVGSGVLETYASHQPLRPSPMGAEGGDGEERDYLPDVAYWGFVATDSRGLGKVRLKLPDNITSWRVTAQAISDRLYAGIAESAIKVSKPLFVESTYAGEYLSADQPIIKARAFGTALKVGQAVQFAMTAPTLGLKQGERIAGAAFVPVEFRLPALREGEHPITVAGSADGLRDVLTKPIRVLGSRLERDDAEFARLAPGVKLKGGATGFTDLLFCDLGRARLYRALCQLRWAYGDRVDQKVARAKGRALLEQYFGWKGHQSPEEFVAHLYQHDDGGVSLLPYSASEPDLSAKIAHVAPDLFDRAALATYFYGILDDRKTDVEHASIALYGLASLQEPVLTLVANGLRSQELQPIVRLRLALAAALLGANDVARINLRRVLRSAGETLKPFIRVKVGADQDDIIEATALAAMLAAAVGAQEHDGLWQYVQENYTTDILINLERLGYVTSLLPRLSSRPVKFTYHLGQRSATERLKRDDTFRLAVTAEDLGRLQFTDIEGDVGVVTRFRRPFRPQEVKQDAELRVARWYEVGGKRTEALADGDVVRIRLACSFRPQAIDGAYQVTDFLPSGLRPLSAPYQLEESRRFDWRYPYSIEGQKVHFLIYKGRKPPHLAYLARVVSKGAYRAEPALMQSVKSPDSICLSEEATVHIR